MKKKWGRILAAVMLLMIVGGCSKEEEANGQQTADEPEKLQIGMCFDSFIIERWQRDRDIFVSTARELGAQVNVQSANGEADEQVRQVQYFIDKDVDVIVIIGIDTDSLAEVILKAKNAGIKVIAYDRPIHNANVDLYISFDNRKVGTMMGEALAEEVPEGGKVLMLEGSPTDSNVPEVEAGFLEVMEAHDISIIDQMYADGWLAELAGAYVYDNFEKVAQADAIMCGNDNIATAVVRALAELRLAGKIPICGQDADLEGCQRIVEGTQTMTVYKPVEKLAKQAAEYAVKLGEGEKIEAEDTMFDGKYTVPYVKLEPISVNRDNLDDVVIADGFHLKEDVYLNVKN